MAKFIKKNKNMKIKNNNYSGDILSINEYVIKI